MTALLLAALLSADRPNVVLIMADDMGWSDLGCTGGEIDTPRLDRLRDEGQLWTAFHNNAKCTTTRASLLSGRYPRYPDSRLPEDTATVADVLSAAGYATHLSGKWHLGSGAPHRPGDRGFDTYYGLLDGCCNFFDPSRPDPKFKGGRVRFFGEKTAETERRIEEFPDDFYTTDAFTDSAVDFIRLNAGRPFFLHVTYTAPHYPLHAPPDLIEKYRGRYSGGWHKLREERHARQIAMGLVDPDWVLPEPGREVRDWSSLTDEERDYQDHLMATYAAMVERMDAGIGRVLDALDAADVADDTLVLFLSDNGGCAEQPGGIDVSRTPGVAEHYTAVGPGWAFAQNTPFRRYKQWCHEGGTTTPLIARLPGTTEPGSHTEAVGHVIDVQPTLMALCDADLPADAPPVEGVSLLPQLRGEAGEPRELFWAWNGSRAVRRGDMKLVRDRGKTSWELYDLSQDRTETRNLINADPSLAADLEDAWHTWADETGVPKRQHLDVP